MRKTRRDLLVWILTSIISFATAKGFYHAAHMCFGQTVRSPLSATAAAHWENTNPTMEPLVCSKETEWRSCFNTAQKANASGAATLSLLGQRWKGRSSSGPAVLSHVRPTLTPRKSGQHSPELWRVIMLHILEWEYMFPAALGNFIETPKPQITEKYPVITSSIPGMPNPQGQQLFSYTWEL